MRKKIFDVSLLISPDMVTWPTDPKVKATPFKSISKGDSSNVTQWQLGTHTGTHIDAPSHFFEEGATVDKIPLEILTGKAALFEISSPEKINQADLKTFPLRGTERVLFKTKNSNFWQDNKFHKDFVYLTYEAAQYLVAIDVKLVGIDYLSIEKFGERLAPVHHFLLENGVVIMEGLNLAGVPAGEYELICLPLKLKEANGAPARVLLREL